MVLSHLQGCFGLSKPGYSSRRISKNQSTLVLGGIIAVHVLIIVLVLNERAKQRKFFPEKILQIINVLPAHEESIPLPAKPELNDLHLPPLNVPHLEMPESTEISFDNSLNSIPNKSPPDVTGQYEGVFDPKMRQKLIDSQGINRPRAHEKSKTWTAIDGRTFIDMGDGNCMVSMSKVDSRDRANNWGYTTCGKNDSEKAMDRVMADFESRRAPVNKLKTH